MRSKMNAFIELATDLISMSKCKNKYRKKKGVLFCFYFFIQLEWEGSKEWAALDLSEY